MDTKDAIILIKNAIPEKLCTAMVNICNKSTEWKQGTWYNYKTNVYSENTHSMLNVSSYVINEFDSYIKNCHKKYKQQVPYYDKEQRFFTVHFNKYEIGDKMDRHVDHIHSIFDGSKKGIPVLSMVGVLNDEFEGGDFVMYDDYKIDLQKGDAVIFPSCFLYPHRVEKVISGIRYSWVSWSI